MYFHPKENIGVMMHRNHSLNYPFLLLLLLVPGILFSKPISSKRGIAFGHNTEADLAAVSKGLSWWYNWYVEPESPVLSNYQNYSMDFVPMVWNAASDTAKLRSYLKSHPNVKYILGFNEPNFKTQANLTPEQAAVNWPRIEELADEFNLKIVGPAVNYCDQCVDIPGVSSDSDPVSYLDAFFASCSDCRVDYIAIHNYMCYTSALESYVKLFLKYNKKIWLTEFACWDQASITLDMQKSLVIGAINYLENDTNIFRYSWFTGDRYGKYPYLDIYGKNSGSLTDLGQLYVNFNPIHDDNIFYDIPSRIEAESYNKMSGIQLEATQDIDGIANIGYYDAGDWLQYNINVPETGDYYLYLRLSSNANTSVSLKENNTVLKSLTVPASGGWQSWKTFSLPLTLEKGHHKLQLYTPTGSLNVNWLAFTKGANTPPSVIADEDTTITLPNNSIYLTCSPTDADGNTLSCKWTKVSGPGTPVIVSPESQSTEITGLSKGDYQFRVSVSDGIETVSDLVKVSVKEALTADLTNTASFKCYPNPVTGILNIEIEPSSHVTQIILLSPDGRVRLNSPINIGETSAAIDLNSIEKGIYFVKLVNPDNSFQQLIIKQ